MMFEGNKFILCFSITMSYKRVHFVENRKHKHNMTHEGCFVWCESTIGQRVAISKSVQVDNINKRNGGGGREESIVQCVGRGAQPAKPIYRITRE